MEEPHQQYRDAINQVVITGRAVTESLTRNVKSHHRETNPHRVLVPHSEAHHNGSVIMKIRLVTRRRPSSKDLKSRTVAVDGELTQHEYVAFDGRKQTRIAIRADRLQLVDDTGDQQSGYRQAILVGCRTNLSQTDSRMRQFTSFQAGVSFPRLGPTSQRC